MIKKWLRTARLCLKRSIKFDEVCLSRLDLDRSKKTVAAVLPCYNYLEYTRRAYESCLNSFSSKHNYVVVVIDDHSDDGTKSFWTTEAAKAKNLLYFRFSKNMGLTQGWNSGIDAAIRKVKADYIFVINNDVVIQDQAFERLISHLDALDGESLIGPVTNGPGHQPEQHIRKIINDYVPSDSMEDINAIARRLAGRPRRKLDYINGFFFGAATKVFTTNRFWKIIRNCYFDPSNRNIGNENEFQRRLHQRGIPSYVAEDVFVFHYKDVTQKRNNPKYDQFRR